MWFVGSAVFHYLGPSFAVLLFARVPVGGVAWLRIVSAALVFSLWRRPWKSFARSSPAEQIYEAWSWSRDRRRPLDRSQVEALMEQLPDEVVRAKGIIWLDDGDRPFVLQRVGGRWTLRRARRGPPDEEIPDSRLVVIGRRDTIDDAWLARRLGR